MKITGKLGAAFKKKKTGNTGRTSRQQTDPRRLQQALPSKKGAGGEKSLSQNKGGIPFTMEHLKHRSGGNTREAQAENDSRKKRFQNARTMANDRMEIGVRDIDAFSQGGWGE